MANKNELIRPTKQFIIREALTHFLFRPDGRVEAPNLFLAARAEWSGCVHCGRALPKGAAASCFLGSDNYKTAEIAICQSRTAPVICQRIGADFLRPPRTFRPITHPTPHTAEQPQASIRRFRHPTFLSEGNFINGTIELPALQCLCASNWFDLAMEWARKCHPLNPTVRYLLKRSVVFAPPPNGAEFGSGNYYYYSAAEKNSRECERWRKGAPLWFNSQA